MTNSTEKDPQRLGKTFSTIFRALQSFWFYLIPAFCLFFVYFTYVGMQVRQMLIENGGIVRPYYHVIYLGIVCVICQLLRLVVATVFKDKIHEIATQGFEKEFWEQRKFLLVKNISCVIWYCFTVSMGVYLFTGSTCVPRQLGGKWELRNIANGWPSPDEVPHLTVFYMASAGYRVYSLLQTLMYERSRKDFGEFMLHHLVTAFGVLFCYFTNMHFLSSIIMYVMEFGDLIYKFGNTLRKFIPHENTLYISIPLLFLFLYFFVYFRIVVLAQWIFPIFHNAMDVEYENFNHPREMIDLYVRDSNIHYSFIMLFSCFMTLWLLNIYWVVLILRVGLRGMMSKKSDFHCEVTENLNLEKKKEN